MSLNLKYPILLVHGLAAKDNHFFWGRIPERLENAGAIVYHGEAEAWGTIKTNAGYLAKKIDHILAKEKCDKVNIIAHSKGGLDSRYLISSLGYADKVASLTTLSTPHRGSRIVDYILTNDIFFKPFFKNFVYTMVKLYEDKSPQPYKILFELSSDNMEKFNKMNPNMPGVYYSSYFSIMKRWQDNFSFYLTFQYLQKLAGDNDGVVCKYSAEWGEDFTIIEGREKGGICHTDMIDVRKCKISGVDIPSIYIGIARKLMERGF